MVLLPWLEILYNEFELSIRMVIESVELSRSNNGIKELIFPVELHNNSEGVPAD